MYYKANMIAGPFEAHYPKECQAFCAENTDCKNFLLDHHHLCKLYDEVVEVIEMEKPGVVWGPKVCEIIDVTMKLMSGTPYEK